MTKEWKKETADLKALLKSLQESLDEHKSDMTTKLDSLEKKIGQDIKDSVKDLQDYFDIEIVRITERCDKIDERVKKLENVQTQRETYDPETTIVVTGLPVEDDEDIVDKAAKLIRQGLGVRDVPPVRAMRLTSRDERPGLVKIQVDTLDNKIKLLKNKTKLKDNDYDNVYIRSSKSHTDRLIELNFKKILEIVPGGDNLRLTANGRLIPKDDDRRPGGQPGNNQRNNNRWGFGNRRQRRDPATHR